MKKHNLILGLVSALFYNAWLLGYWLNPAVMSNALLSALGASDQPYFYLFILTDILSAGFLLALVLGFRSLFARSLIVFATLNILAGIFPQTRAHPDFSSGVNMIHAVFSSLAIIALVLAVLLAIWKIKKARFTGLSLINLVGIGLSSISASFPNLLGHWTQQVSAILIGLWLIGMAVYLPEVPQVASSQADQG
ncbi:DUF998 domain-containing protein [Lactococcus termiticola]|uniref:DUF998 domain-containing protein n=1 Tax=Lactococcus termiticola TaxID=2169526 RepID=A0A2R5HGV7_9LACT|nr:DUF998 domain-containing protein [Lactococcus termiticola]GBG97222.1 hypothetical protein NtB2_01360 [Lactococcus termiticola]